LRRACCWRLICSRVASVRMGPSSPSRCHRPNVASPRSCKTALPFLLLRVFSLHCPLTLMFALCYCLYFSFILHPSTFPLILSRCLYLGCVSSTSKFAFFVTAYECDGNNIPIIPILLPPRFVACGTTSSAPRVASRSPRRSRSTRPSSSSSEALLFRRCLCFACATTTLKFAFLLPRRLQHSDHSFFVTPSFRSLRDNELGPKVGIAIAEALKINKTITDIS
jgi:hypothetical protein